MEAILSKSKISELFSWVLEGLADKEREVITRRIWLSGEKETLQSIWNTFSITRERVRQIEDTWINKMGRIIRGTELALIQDKAIELIEMHGGLLSRDKIVNWIIKELNLSNDVDWKIISIIIQADYNIKKSKPKLWVGSYFYFSQKIAKKIQVCNKNIVKILKKKKDVMDILTLTEILKMNLKEEYTDISLPFVDSVIDIHEDLIKWEERLVWLASWKILNPKTLKDKAVYVLMKEKLPMHFVDISNKISDYLWDTVKVNTVHNELIRNDDFVLVWRWIYVLKDWGYKPGTVLDVIKDILEKNSWEPMTTEEISAKVLKSRNVKKSTIYMNLQNRDYIERVWRNYYKLK